MMGPMCSKSPQKMSKSTYISVANKTVLNTQAVVVTKLVCFFP